jgi:hypothetical protein
VDHDQSVLPFDADHDLHGAQARAQRDDDNVVVQLPSGELKWSDDLTAAEAAAGYRVRRDLATPRDPPF